MFHNIETKVYAAPLGGTASAAVTAAILWLLGVLVWHSPDDAGNAGAAIAAVPWPISGLMGFVIVGAGTFLAGYAAPHSTRPDLTAKAAVSTSAVNN